MKVWIKEKNVLQLACECGKSGHVVIGERKEGLEIVDVQGEVTEAD